MSEINRRFMAACTQGDFYTFKNTLSHLTCNELALIYCADKNRLEFIVLLIDSGVDINHQNSDGNNALIVAAHDGNLKVVEFLIERSSNLDLQNKYGESALMHSFNNKEIFDLLINSGANIDITDSYGYSALIRATFDKNHVAIKSLVECGANVNLVDDQNRTALDVAIKNEDLIAANLINNGLFDLGMLMIACENKDEEAILFSVEKNANFFIEDEQGESPYKILKRKRKLSPALQSLKERLIFEQIIVNHTDENLSL